MLVPVVQHVELVELDAACARLFGMLPAIVRDDVFETLAAEMLPATVHDDVLESLAVECGLPLVVMAVFADLDSMLGTVPTSLLRRENCTSLFGDTFFFAVQLVLWLSLLSIWGRWLRI